MITRTITKKIEQSLFQGQTILLYGARQVGKTTILHDIIDRHGGIYLNGDLLKYQEIFSSQDDSVFQRAIGDHTLVVIDEAQNIPNIGINLKILHDSFPDRQFIASGSSSFELANRVHEPMTGRIKTITLYPLSHEEIIGSQTSVEFTSHLPDILTYGLYPDIYTSTGQTQRTKLDTLANLYLFKDVLSLDGIQKPQLIVKITKILASQISQELSLNELANTLDTNIPTLQRYINILEQSFIIFSLPSFHRNLRKELQHKKKYYFRDIGIRNALLESYGNIEYRTDKEALRENFVIVEKLKYHHYQQHNGSYAFWRTYDQQEVDLIYHRQHDIQSAREIKRSDRKPYTPPTAFVDQYHVTPQLIHPHTLGSMFQSS